jgi:hypothetical protein
LKVLFSIIAPVLEGATSKTGNTGAMKDLSKSSTELQSRPGPLPFGGRLPLLRPMLCRLLGFNAQKGPDMTGKCAMDK